jgi:hypothetical protein
MSKKLLLFAALAGGSLAALSVGGAALAAPEPAARAAPPASAADLSALQAEVEALKARLDAQATTTAQETTQLQRTQADLAATQAQLAAAKASADQAIQTARSDQQQVQSIPTQVESAVAAAKPKDDGKIHYKGVTITLGGFSELAGIYRSNDETADIASSYSKIPFANDKASHTGETRLTARQSRYSALIEGDPTSAIHLGFYGEFDFQGGAQTANSNQSDSYNPRIRNLYGTVDWDTYGLHLLAGQNWSLVTQNTQGITPRNEAPPAVIDAQYVPGFAWARQPQLRLTKDFGKKWWVAVSVENPQTTFGNVTPASGVSLTNTQLPTNGYFNGTSYSLNRYPDVVGKVAYEGSIGDHPLHLEALGLLRSFYDRVTINPTTGSQAATLGYVAGTGNDSTTGGGWGAGFTFALLPKVIDLQGSILSGKGIGRYGSGGLPDVTAAPDGKLEGLQETMWMAGATVHATKAIDIYAYGGQEADTGAGKVFTSPALPGAAFGYGTLPGSNNTGCFVEGGTCSPVTKSIDQYAIGVWDKVYQGSFGRLQIGAEFSHTNRETFADINGVAPRASENMVFTSIRYYPF